MGFDTFYLVVNLVDNEWVPWCIMVGIFEAALAEVVKWLLNEFGLSDQVLVYVKDERTNLNTLTTALKLVVKCKPLELDKPHGNCFRHVMSKAWQYGIKDIVLCTRMTCVSLKNAQATLQIIMTWTKKFGKGIIDWHKTCVEVRFLAKKLKTLVKTQFASKVVLFR